MRYVHLVWRNLLRKKARTLFTVLSIMVAFVLFAFLTAVDQAFSMGVDITGNDRLIMIHKVSLIQPLPLSYLEKVRQVEGVTDATHASWFGGIYIDRKNFFPQLPVVPEEFLRIYPEFVVPEDQKKAWFADRTGAVAGRRTAERFGWKIGDRIPIRSPIWRTRDGSQMWEFTLRGIYDGAEPGVDETNFLFHFKYFDERRAWGDGLVGWYYLSIDDPDRAAEIGGRIDSMFANSRYETKTTTEKAFIQAFADQVGNIGAILRWVLAAVFFTILLVAGNTMAQSVRERTGELAVLKTLGFTNGAVLALVLAEALVLACLGGGLGLALGWLFVGAVDPLLQNYLAVFHVPARAFLIGIALAVGLGVVCGTQPALRAMRLRIVDGMRRA
jgi:putative ABC transport system permease protein